MSSLWVRTSPFARDYLPTWSSELPPGIWCDNVGRSLHTSGGGASWLAGRDFAQRAHPHHSAGSSTRSAPKACPTRSYSARSAGPGREPKT